MVKKMVFLDAYKKFQVLGIAKFKLKGTPNE